MGSPSLSRKFWTTLIVAPIFYLILSGIYFAIVKNPLADLEAQNSLFFVYLSVGLIHLALAPLMHFIWHEPYLSLLGAGKKRWHFEFMNAQIFLVAIFLSSEPLFLWLNWDHISFHWQSDWRAWWLWLLPMIVAVALQASGEELFFRGFFQGKLRAMGISRARAIFIPALIWAIIHQAQFDEISMKLVVVVQIFVLGLALGDWFDRTGSLVGPILVHFLMNIFNSLIYGNTLRLSNFDILQADFSHLRLANDVFYIALGAIAIMIAYEYLIKRRLGTKNDFS